MADMSAISGAMGGGGGAAMGGMGGMNYAGMALQVIGDTIQLVGMQQAKRRMQHEFQDEARRQGRLSAQAQGIWQPYASSLGVEQARTDMAAGQAKRQTGYNQVQSTPMTLNQPFNPLLASDQAYAGMMGQAQSKLGAYGDWGLEQELRNLHMNQQIARISDTAGGQARIYPMRMYAAQHEGDQLLAIGKAISDLGKMSPDPSVFGAKQPPGRPPPGGGGGENWQWGGTGLMPSSQWGAFQAGQGPVSQQYAYSWANQPYVPYMGSGQSMYGGFP